MTSTFALLKDIQIDGNVAVNVRKFLFSEEDDQQNARKSSTSSYESTSSADAEKSANVDEWTPFTEQENSQENTSDPEEFWLGDCVTSTYSSLEYFLVCRGLRWVLLRRKSSDEHVFDCETMKAIERKSSENEQIFITQCCIFALGSSRQSELVDCLIVAIGTSSGSVIFYTESGKMLFEESFATDQPILRISIDYSEDGQLFSVVTAEDIFAVNAFSLHTTLLQSKLAIAKGEKTAAQLSETVEMEMTRFKIEDKAQIKDAIFTGMQQPTAFDQYVRASLEDFNSLVDRAAPSYSTFFVHTDRMFATFSWFPEGEDSNLWSETVNKIATSIMPSFGIRKFLGISHGPARKSALSQQRHKAMNRSTLNDNRQILRMVKAPRPRPWIAVVDNLARVLIMDWKTRHVMRWFKGYRDAQIAFITASHEGSTVVFLVIFAPRRSLLEVWPLIRGSRVAAITVDPNGILLEGGTVAVMCGKRETGQSTSFFIDSQGSISKIVVPYHLAFLESDNREHDQLVLAKISTFSETGSAEEFLELYSSLNDASSKRLAFLKVVSTCSQAQLKRLLEELKKEEQLSIFDEDQKESFEEILNRCSRVLHAYEKLKLAMEKRQELSDKLDIHLSKDNVDLVKRHLEVGDEKDASYPVAEVLISTVTWTAEYTNILEKNIPDVDIMQICRIVFEPILWNAMDLDVFVDQILPHLPFSKQTFAALFAHYLLSGKEKIGMAFPFLIKFLEFLSKKDEGFLPQLDKSAVESPNVSRALLISAAIWIVKVRIQQGQEHDESLEEAEQEWESFDPTLEHHDCTLLAMHAVWLLSSIRPGVTYSKMMSIASWVADKQISFDDFEDSVKEADSITELFALIPKVLETNSMYADVGWELMSYWFKAKMDNMQLLKEAVVFISKIDNNRLRHGVAKLVWEKFILDSVKSFSSIVEKTGRAPKERETKQYLQMHDRQLEIFLEAVCHILDILWQSVRDMYVISAASVDHFLEIAFSHPIASISKVGTGRDSLVHIAVVQQPVNYHLVIHHLHLLKVYILLRTGMRVRPLSTVFCAIGQRAFFHPLDSHPLIPLEKVDDGTLENRHKFLSKAVEIGNEDDRKMAREMASEWALTVDQIALVEALAHFRQGDDTRGSKELSSITSSQVGIKLAKLLSARILRLADSKKTVLTATHLRVLQDASGDEQGRVDWNGDWLEAVESMSRIMKSLTLLPEHTAIFVKIMSIATQYWGL